MAMQSNFKKICSPPSLPTPPLQNSRTKWTLRHDSFQASTFFFLLAKKSSSSSKVLVEHMPSIKKKKYCLDLNNIVIKQIDGKEIHVTIKR